MKDNSSFAMKLLMLAVTAALLLYFGVESYLYFEDPFVTTPAAAYQVDDAISLSGWVIREEQVLASEEGLLHLRRGEGERVSDGGVLATVYTDQSAMDRQTELDQIQRHIEQLEYAQSSAYGSESAMKLDAQIQESILKLQTAMAKGQLDTAGDIGGELKAMILKRDYASANPEETAAQLQELRQRKKELENLSAASARTVYSPASGYFSAVTDGYEAQLTLENVQAMKPSDLASLRPTGETSSVGKLVLGDEWYYAAPVRSADLKRLQEKSTLTFRFSSGAAGDLPVTIHAVGPEDGSGRVLVIFQGRTHLRDLTAIRQQSAQIILDTLSGIRVPTKALRILTETETRDGQEREVQIQGLYCVVGAESLIKPVEVLYTGDGFLLVQTDTKALSRWTSTNAQERRRLRPGDQVVVSGSGLYDGKVVDRELKNN